MVFIFGVPLELADARWRPRRWYALPAIPVEKSAHEASRQPWLLPALSALFFCSGMSALIYQVLWLRLLGLVFGVTTYAASTVWAVFMAGLAIGRFPGGRGAGRPPPAP